ncbi:hypothetical protein DJ568_16460 [Mucilaginibacter hurinus]|uniref:Uncharacterized protein n=1 Tax=Mucilaginibacter hurinus TaxID=2201324 RepID=A0A367GKZ6_9SPHI|nr:hypothetical protein [Mucilaginibacter hurinus]RCH53628.1 hypothetical protein DJ568_16460 [Mucilaginibacter hurinus]
MNIESEKEWITEFIRTNLNDDITDRIKHFALLWNLFETFACNKFATVASIIQAVDHLNAIQQIDLNTDRYLDYFSARYIDINGVETTHFQSLNFRKPDKKQLVLNVLLRKETEPKEILKAVLIIVYRYRNNLFHGEKNVAALNAQAANFEHANSILIDFLTILKRNYLVGQFNRQS